MRSNPRTILITIFSMFLVLALGGINDISAQGKGRGGGGGNRGGGGGGQPQVQRQAPPQRQQAQRRQMQQPQRQQAQRQMPQMQRQQPQRQAQRQQPRVERPQQVQRQQPRFERPQVQRQQPQVQRRERQAQRQQPQQRFERPQMQRQQPQVQRQERQAQQRQQRQQRPQQTDRQNRGRGNQANIDRGREARAVMQVERQRPSIMRVPTERGNRGQQNVQNRQAEFQRERGNGRAARMDRQSMTSQDRGSGRQARFSQVGDVQTLSSDRGRGGKWRQQGGSAGGQMFSSQNDEFRAGRGSWGRSAISPSSIDLSGFRDRERAWQQQARSEGWAFNENDFRLNAYDYTVREAWRDDVIRSVINVNIGYPNDYYYIAPPSYPAYWGVNYQPWYYNVGYTYYDPYYSNYYVQPYYMAYAPYDYYYSSYYYDDPYYFNDPYDDYVTYRIFSSNSVGGFVTRLLGSLLATGYDQGYRDGLMARQSGYAYTESYSDPYAYYYDQPQYETVTYEPYLYGSYEDRYCLSKGYDLGYQDAFYGYNDSYDPYYAEGNIDIVSLYVGTTFSFNV